MYLYQPIDGYCYNSDTHILFDFIQENLHECLNPHGDMLDIGSGSGILGLLLAKEFKKINLFQCEIQKEMVFFSNHNSKINNISNTMFEGDFLKMDFNQEFDIIVSNPPFYHKDVNKSTNENINFARYNNHLPLEDFILKISKIIAQKGKLFFCYDAKQLQEIIILLNRFHFGIEALKFVYPKDSKNANLVLISARRNSKSLMKVQSPIIMFDNDKFNDKITQLYKKIDTHSIKAQIDKEFL